MAGSVELRTHRENDLTAQRVSSACYHDWYGYPCDTNSPGIRYFGVLTVSLVVRHLINELICWISWMESYQLVQKVGDYLLRVFVFNGLIR